MAKKIQQAVEFLNQGGTIAYPTEAVYGLGCDPFNATAVEKLATLKLRDTSKRFIIIAAEFLQVQSLIATIPANLLEMAKATWPGPVTWVFPVAQSVPNWLRNEANTIAVRVTAHPIANALCKEFGKPIVSTSANLSGELPARDAAQARSIFGNKIDFIVDGAVGGLDRPTEIRDVLTGKILRL